MTGQRPRRLSLAGSEARLAEKIDALRVAVVRLQVEVERSRELHTRIEERIKAQEDLMRQVIWLIIGGLATGLMAFVGVTLQKL